METISVIKNEEVLENKPQAKKIFKTLFKKGNIVENLHFEHPGPLALAVSDVKKFLTTKHLKHIHTVPFIIDLNEPLEDNEDFLQVGV